MQPLGVLIGRAEDHAALDRTIQAVHGGRGGLLLVTGEAGVGKSALVHSAVAASDLLPLVGQANHTSVEPYGPIIAVLRDVARRWPTLLREPGPFANQLHMLLPELGSPPESSDQPRLFQAVRWSLERIAAHQPAIVLLDDLHWADEATIDLLSAASQWLERVPLLIIGIYGSDELSRDHPLRRLRLDLRRAGRARELTVEPLDADGTAALAARVLGAPLSAPLRAILHDRTQGLPFFVEELAAALASSGRLQPSADGLGLDQAAALPVPESVRDAVRLRAHGLGDEGRAALQAAAVVGPRFDLDLVVELAGGDRGIDELLDTNIVAEVGTGVGRFRHALVRETVYGDIPWARRRALHRAVAERLESRGAPPGPIAEHWSAANQPERARRALVAAAEAFCALHAYRDAERAASRALALWADDTAPERLELLERLGQCAELSGGLAEAARAWRDAAEGWRNAGQVHRAATIERRLATVYEMQGAWEQSLAARLSAAEGFAATGLPGDAAAERMAVAGHLRSAASFTAALGLLETVHAEADLADRPDLRVRAMGLEGNVRARMGEYEVGLALVRDALARALDRNLIGPAAEVYQRLGDTLEHASKYAEARDAYDTASDFCRTREQSAVSQLCLACMTYVLRQMGEWDRAVQVCRDILGTAGIAPHAAAAAAGMLGAVLACRGDSAQARPLLLQSATQARLIELASMEILNSWSFALIEQLEGNTVAASEHCRALLSRWERTEERHYSISPLRWSATFFATNGAGGEARACASALSRIASETGNAESLAALAHALGETLLLEEDGAEAARQFEQALALLRDVPLPFDAAQTHLRAGVALTTVGQRESALVHLNDGYRIARRLGARPLAAEAARLLAALGEPPDRRAGQRAGRSAEHGGLSRRELEVLRHVALGRTDREIAGLLFLSPRTVEMHVGNCLAKLGCRTRAEAIRRAAELAILAD
ncbi:MAG: AAA family ATPase [Chloroflexota bacterium]